MHVVRERDQQHCVSYLPHISEYLYNPQRVIMMHGACVMYHAWS